MSKKRIEKKKIKNNKKYNIKEDKYIYFLIKAFDSWDVIQNKTLSLFESIKKNRFTQKKKIVLINELNEIKTKEIENITIFQNYVYNENYKKNKKSDKWKKDPWNDDKWLSMLEEETK